MSPSLDIMKVRDLMEPMGAQRWRKDVSIRVLFALYICLLVKIILLKFHPMEPAWLWGRLLSNLHSPDFLGQRLQAGNLVPLREITRSLKGMTAHEMVNLFGNVLIFMPFGLLLGLMFRHKDITWIETLLYAFAASFSLECAQLLLAIGQFDVDDLILNTGGALLGYFVYRIRAAALKQQGAVRTEEG